MDPAGDWEIERERMVREQIEKRGIHETRLLDVMRRVPRHRFVHPPDREIAYNDHPVHIGEGQTVSQPYIVALMTSLLTLEGNEKVLEVGTGSGYQAAVLGCLAAEVHTIERIPSLAEGARKVLAELGYANVFVHEGDGTLGWEDSAPYDAVLVAAAAPRAPQPLLDQLAPGGRLVLPVGPRYAQDLQVWRREIAGFSCESIIPVVFVPLLGTYGWKEHEF